MPDIAAPPRPARKAQASKPTSLPYIDLFHASPAERIALIKRGVPAAQVKRIIADLDITQAAMLKALNLSTATVNKKAKGSDTLSPAESERVLGIAKLVGQVQAMVQDSGTPEGFNAPLWLAHWLQAPLPALGGQRPIDLIDTMEGQTVVATALSQIQSGAYG